MLDNISVQCDQLSRHFSRLAGISGWERIDEAMALVQRVSVIVRSLLEQGRTQAATGYRSQPIHSGLRVRQTLEYRTTGMYNTRYAYISKSTVLTCDSRQCATMLVDRKLNNDI